MVIDALLADLLVKRACYPSRRGLRKYPKLFANIFSTLGDLSKMLLESGTRVDNIKLPLEKEKGIVVIAVSDPCLEDCSLIPLLKASDLKFKPSGGSCYFTEIEDISLTKTTLNPSTTTNTSLNITLKLKQSLILSFEASFWIKVKYTWSNS